jgi:hypothetical protein
MSDYKQAGKIFTLPLKPTDFGGEELIWDDYTIDMDMFWYMENGISINPNTIITCPECGKPLFQIDDFNYDWEKHRYLNPLAVHVRQHIGEAFHFTAVCPCGWFHGFDMWSHEG